VKLALHYHGELQVVFIINSNLWLPD